MSEFLNPYPWRGNNDYYEDPSKSSSHGWWELPRQPVTYIHDAKGNLVRERKSNEELLKTLQPQVAELVSAPVSNEQSAHQLRQELRLLRELLVSERKKVAGAKAELEAAAENAPRIFSAWDMITGQDVESDLHAPDQITAAGVQKRADPPPKPNTLAPHDRKVYVLDRALDHKVTDSGLIMGQGWGKARSYNQH
mmetsp:Transcript_43471/g.98255  ORF Transcript_43471/g.98255 Transcript_43471/m.98255 type:complete len:195 (-) Transcript_43471:196-780(-)